MKEDITDIFNKVVTQRKLKGDLSKDVWVAYNPTKEDLEKLDPYTKALGFKNTISISVGYIENDTVNGLAFDPQDIVFGFIGKEDTTEELKGLSKTGKLIELSPQDFVSALTQVISYEINEVYVVSDGITKENLAKLDGITTWSHGEDPSDFEEATQLEDLSDTCLIWHPVKGLDLIDPITFMLIMAVQDGKVWLDKFIKVDSFEEFVSKIKEGE